MFDLGTRLGLVLSLAALTSAVEWKGPKATPVNQHLMAELGFSPKPTEAPKIRGRMPGHELFARDDPAVLCGYVSGSMDNPVTCPDFRRSCFFNTIIKAVGCCSNASDPPESCAQYTSCIDSSDMASCTGSCLNDLLIVRCTDSASAFCQTYQWTKGYSNLGCGTYSFSSYVELTYSGETLQSTSSSMTNNDFTSSSTVTSAPLTSGTSTSSTAATTVVPDSAKTTNTSSSSSSTHIGPIVGGVVGGLAVLVALALGIFFLLRRKNTNPAVVGGPGVAGAAVYKPAPGAPPMQQMPQQQYTNYDSNLQQAPLSPAPQYNPHQAAYYDPNAAIVPPPVKAEYSQNIQAQQPPTSIDQPAYQATAQGYAEMPYNPATSPVSQTQSPPPQQQFQRPQGPIYEAPSDHN